MQLFTIGFTQKTAQKFFDLLERNGVKRVIDIRLHPEGQLAGFAKKEDLRYFLKELVHCDYQYLEQLTPTAEIMKTYRSGKDPVKFEASFNALMDKRDIPTTLDRGLFEEKVCCLLCGESKPDHCHRRFVAERLAKEWGDVTIIHL